MGSQETFLRCSFLRVCDPILAELMMQIFNAKWQVHMNGLHEVQLFR